MAYKVGGDDAYVSNGKLEEVMHCLEALEPKFIHVASLPCEQTSISWYWTKSNHMNNLL